MLTVQVFGICAVFLSFWVLRRTERGRGTPVPGNYSSSCACADGFLWNLCEDRSQEFLAIAMAAALIL